MLFHCSSSWRLLCCFIVRDLMCCFIVIHSEVLCVVSVGVAVRARLSGVLEFQLYAHPHSCLQESHHSHEGILRCKYKCLSS